MGGPNLTPNKLNQTLVLNIKEKILKFARPKNSPLTQTTLTVDVNYKQRILARKNRPTIILMEKVRWYEDFLRVLVTWKFTSEVYN